MTRTTVHFFSCQYGNNWSQCVIPHWKNMLYCGPLTNRHLILSFQQKLFMLKFFCNSAYYASIFLFFSVCYIIQKHQPIIQKHKQWLPKANVLLYFSWSEHIETNIQKRVRYNCIYQALMFFAWLSHLRSSSFIKRQQFCNWLSSQERK